MLCEKSCPPPKVINILKAMHTDMLVTVKVNGEITESFPITASVKQGCIIAPTLFIIYFDTMLQEALRGFEEGIHIGFKTGALIFNLNRLRAKTKTKRYLPTVNCSMSTTVAYSLTPRRTFDYCLTTLQELQRALAYLSVLQKRKSCINLCQTILMWSQRSQLQDNISKWSDPSFAWAASCQTTASLIDSRIAKASSSIGRLHSRVWSSHDLKLTTKISVYRAVVLRRLLYTAETWTPY